jgi:hypothetical protein
VVGWGCGEIFQALRLLQSFPLKYVIHTDSKLWGSRILGVEVRGPDSLAQEDPAQVVVFIYSQEYETAIRDQTAALGPFQVYSFRDPEFFDHRYGLLRNLFEKAAGHLPPPPLHPLAEGDRLRMEDLRRSYDDGQMREALQAAGISTVETVTDSDALCRRLSRVLDDGAALGWFQGDRGRAILARADLVPDLASRLDLHGGFTSPVPGQDDRLDALCQALEPMALAVAAFTIKGLPPVTSPAEALRSFSWSGLDYLVMGPYLIHKEFF